MKYDKRKHALSYICELTNYKISVKQKKTNK